MRTIGAAGIPYPASIGSASASRFFLPYPASVSRFFLSSGAAAAAAVASATRARCSARAAATSGVSSTGRGAIKGSVSWTGATRGAAFPATGRLVAATRKPLMGSAT